MKYSLEQNVSKCMSDVHFDIYYVYLTHSLHLIMQSEAKIPLNDVIGVASIFIQCLWRTGRWCRRVSGFLPDTSMLRLTFTHASSTLRLDLHQSQQSDTDVKCIEHGEVIWYDMRQKRPLSRMWCFRGLIIGDFATIGVNKSCNRCWLHEPQKIRQMQPCSKAEQTKD